MMNDAGLYQLGLGIIKTTYDDLNRNKRAMMREFKRRHIFNNSRFEYCRWKFKMYHAEYKRCLKFFNDPNNIWFAWYNIEPDYFIRLMEEQNHDNAAN